VHLFTWSAAQFQALNPIWIPLLAFAHTRFAQRGRDIPIAAKHALGFLVVAIGFFVFGLSGR
jgi:POT family proton-dependent oligopeptide transporter